MNTLYINIKGDDIKSTENMTVVGKPEDAIINKFCFELVKGIVKGVTVPGIGEVKKKSLVTDFEVNNAKAFAKITEQWDLVKQALLGENPDVTFTVTLPQEYVEWLYNHSDLRYNKVAESLASRGNAVGINVGNIYRNGLLLLVNVIDTDKEYDQFVVSDALVDDESAIAVAIRKRIGEDVPLVAFVGFEFENEPQKPQNIKQENKRNKRIKEVRGKYYNIFELNAMSLKKLKQIAKEKGIDDNCLDRAQLIYGIIDNQDDQQEIIDKRNEITVDWDELFPVLGVTLGETDIDSIAERKNLQGEIEKEGSKRHGYYYRTLVLERKKRYVSLRQYEESRGIHSIVYGFPYRGDDARFPEKWRKVFGFELGAPSDDVEKELKKRGVEILNKEEGDEYEDGMVWYVKTPDEKFLLTLDFSVNEDADDDEKNRLDSIEITRGECPYCESKDFEISIKTKGPTMMECNNCGRKWLVF